MRHESRAAAEQEAADLPRPVALSTIARLSKAPPKGG
jgi:hypothetical protein